MRQQGGPYPQISASANINVAFIALAYLAIVVQPLGMTNANRLKQAVQIACMTRGVHQYTIACEIGVRPTTLSQWCSGKKTPGPKWVPLIAKVLGLGTADVVRLLGLESP